MKREAQARPRAPTTAHVQAPSMKSPSNSGLSIIGAGSVKKRRNEIMTPKIHVKDVLAFSNGVLVFMMSDSFSTKSVLNLTYV